MKRKLPTGIFAASIIAVCMVSRAQTNIYSLNVVSYIHPNIEWVFINGWSSSTSNETAVFTPSTGFGFSQWEKRNYLDPGYVPGGYPTHTLIYYGPHSLNIRAPAWVLGLGAVFIVGLSSWLAIDAIRRMRE
jgi:hypothetical protein